MVDGYALRSTGKQLFNAGVTMVTLSQGVMIVATVATMHAVVHGGFAGILLGVLFMFLATSLLVLGILFLNATAERQRDEEFTVTMDEMARELKDAG